MKTARKFRDSAQTDFRKQIKVPISKGMNEEESKNPEDIKEKEMHQPVYNNNINFQQESRRMCQQEDELEIEIEKLRMLMMKVNQRRNIEVNKSICNRVQLIRQDCINKADGVLHNYVWDPGNLQATTMQQKDKK
jgi:hypothetical protein